MSLRSLQPKQNQCKERKLFLLFRPQKAFEASWARRRPGGEFFCCCFLRVFRRRTRNCVDSWLCGRTGARRLLRGCSTKPNEEGGEADRQHRLHPKKLCQAWQSFPSTPLAKRRPAGYPNHTYAICMLCTYLPSLPPLLITVTFCDFNLPRSTEAIWGQFKMPLKVIFSQVFPKVPIELELRIGISE